MPKVPLEEKAPRREPDPEIVKRDPMADIFGPGSGLRMIGDPEKDQIPDEVRTALDNFGLSEKTFNCTLREIPEGSSMEGKSNSENTQYIRGWIRSIPSVEHIAKEYGPGNYVLVLTWRGSDVDDPDSKGYKNYKQDIPITISNKYMEEFKKHRLAKKIEQAREAGSQVHDALVEKRIEGSMIQALGGNGLGDKTPQDAAKEYISSALETVKSLGIPVGMAQPKTIEWDKILPVAATILTAYLQHSAQAERSRQEDFNKMLMLMMSTSEKSSGMLMEVMKVQSGLGSGTNQFKEIRDMIFGAIDIKNALAGDKEDTLSDKIFRMVEAVAPQILTIAATAAQAQAQRNNPMVKMAKGYIASNPDFLALKDNPVEMKAFILKMDGFFGWRQTDVILQVAGWDRPAGCPRVPEMELPSDDRTAEPPSIGPSNEDSPLGESAE
jgi:hypothetical protein